MRWFILFVPIIRILSIIVDRPMDLYLRLRRPQEYRYYHLNEWARDAYYKKQYEAAEALAIELLQLSETLPRTWNYGNAVHGGYQALGLVALARGDVEQAKTYLLKAGSTPGSPQLNSYGPRMILARELLKLGEKDTVRKYLKSVEKFMTREQPRFDQYDWYHRALRDTHIRINQWKRDVEAGRIPTGNNWEDPMD